MRSFALILTTTLFGGAHAQNLLEGARFNSTCESWTVNPDAGTTKLLMSAKCSFNGQTVCSQLDLSPHRLPSGRRSHKTVIFWRVANIVTRSDSFYSCFKEENGWLIAVEKATIIKPLSSRKLPQDHAHPNEAWETFLQDGIDNNYTVDPADPDGVPASTANCDEGEDDDDSGEEPGVSNSTGIAGSRFKVRERDLKHHRRAVVRQDVPREGDNDWFPYPVHAASFMTKLGPGDSYTGKFDTRMMYQSNDRDNNQMPGGYKGPYIEMANIIGAKNGILFCPGAPNFMGVATNC